MVQRGGRQEEGEGEAQSVLSGLRVVEGSVQMVDPGRMRERDKLCLSGISGFPSAPPSAPDLGALTHRRAFHLLIYPALFVVFIACSSLTACEPYRGKGSSS